MPKYTITESVGNRIEPVDTFEDLAKHHPSSGQEHGRQYEKIDGKLEEVRHLDGHTYIKKDFILSQDTPGPVNVPAPATGYVHYLHDATNAVRIYDRPANEPGAVMLSQTLHMTRDTSPPEGSRIEYGQPMGRMGDTGSPGSIHVHVEAELGRFQKYIHDIDNGTIQPHPLSARTHNATPQHAPAQHAHPAQPAHPAHQTQPRHPANGAPQPATGAHEYGADNALGRVISRGEGGYNSYNRGHAGDSHGQIDFSQLTVGEVMRRQGLPGHDPNQIFAVGKYQITPGPLHEAVNSLHLDPQQRFTPQLQERVFAEYLINEKRPAVHAYITGQSSGPHGLERAQLALAQEFASVADPHTGRSYYDGQAGNSASITAGQVGTALNQMREQYQHNIQSGLPPDQAYRALSGTPHAQTQTQTATPPEHPHAPAPAHVSTPSHAHAPAQAASGNMLAQGSHGDEVRKLQADLNKLHYTDAKGKPLEVDGKFGPDTKHALESFQRDHHLKQVDGIAGPKTLDAMQHANAKNSTLRLDDPKNPDYPLYKQAHAAVEKLDANLGRKSDVHSDQLAAAAVVAAKQNHLDKIDVVRLSGDGSQVMVVQGDPDSPNKKAAYVHTAQAVNTPVEQSSQAAQAITQKQAEPAQVPNAAPQQRGNPALIA